MPTVTPADMASWPPPNYESPVTCVGLLYGVEVPFAALMTLVMMTRFYSKWVMRRVLGWDDWMMLLAWACILTNTIIPIVGIRWGVAHHLWDVKPEWISRSLQMNLAYEGLFSVGAALTKISICLTYLRVFPMRTSNVYFCRAAIAYCIAWCIATFFAKVFQCRPVSDYWHLQKPDRHCISEKALLIAEAALNSLSDLAVFLWPARFLWGMTLPRDQRLGLIGLFCVGCMICIASVVRMWYFTIYFASYDIYWYGVRNYIILAIETNLGIFCGCLPYCKTVMTKFFPCCFRSQRVEEQQKDEERAENYRDVHSGRLYLHDWPSLRNRPEIYGWSTDGTTLKMHGTHDDIGINVTAPRTKGKSDVETAIHMEDLRYSRFDHDQQALSTQPSYEEASRVSPISSMARTEEALLD